jgi:hypothetical protein
MPSSGSSASSHPETRWARIALRASTGPAHGRPSSAGSSATGSGPLHRQTITVSRTALELSASTVVRCRLPSTLPREYSAGGQHDGQHPRRHQPCAES